MINALTIDVEDYFHVSAFERHIAMGDWPNYPARVTDNTRIILDILDRHQTKATFFILGWVAQNEPKLVKEIAGRGHEIASHGYWHQRVPTQTRDQFRNDIVKSKAILEDLTGDTVQGYRAPSYSVSLDTLWVFDELIEAGYSYDSSVFPVRHDFYGIPDWPRFPFFVSRAKDGQWLPEKRMVPVNSREENKLRMLELPISTLKIAGMNLPIAGGGYFRFFPYFFSEWGLRRINRVEGKSFIFYLHPWEIDPGQPRIEHLPIKSKFRHYLNLDRTVSRFEILISSFHFTTIQQMVRQVIPSGPTQDYCNV